MVKMPCYKSCVVPMCTNTTGNSPKKLFIQVPKCPKRRKQWLKLARRDPNAFSEKTVLHFCEDHFDLPNDMENYIRFHIVGRVGNIRMKADCVPSKFECQPDRRKRTAPPQIRSAVNKRQRMELMREIFSEEIKTPSTSATSSLPSATDKDECVKKQATQVCPEAIDKIIQKYLANTKRKPVQTQIENENTVPLNTDVISTLSPFKITSQVGSAGHTTGKSVFQKKLGVKNKIINIIKVSSHNSLPRPKHSQLNTTPYIRTSYILKSTRCDQKAPCELSAIKMKDDSANLRRISVENTIESGRAEEVPIDDQTDYQEVYLNDTNTEPLMMKIEDDDINDAVTVKSEPDSNSDEQEVFLECDETVQPVRDDPLHIDIKEQCAEGYESVIPAVDAFSVALFLLENPGYTGGVVSSWAARGAGAVTVCGAPEPAPRGITLQCRCGDVPVRCALTEGVAPALSCACGAACCDHCLLVLLYLHRATCPTPPLPPPLPTLPT